MDNYGQLSLVPRLVAQDIICGFSLIIGNHDFQHSAGIPRCIDKIYNIHTCSKNPLKSYLRPQRTPLNLSIPKIQTRSRIRIIPHLHRKSHRPLPLPTLPLPLGPNPNIIPLQQLNQNTLNLITSEEAPRTRPSPVAKHSALARRRNELVLVLLARVRPQIAEAPGVELVEGWLRGHGGQELGVQSASVASLTD